MRTTGRPTGGSWQTPSRCCNSASHHATPHRLHIHELADAVGAQLAPVPRPLGAAERQARVGGHHPVDEHHSRFELVDEPALLGFVVGPRAGAQPELSVVRQPDGLFDSIRAVERRHRSEQLLAVRGRVLRHIRQHRGRVVVARPVEPLPAGEHARAHGHRAAHLLVEPFENIRRGERPHLRGFVHGVAHPQRRHARHQRPLELRGNPRVHDEALGGNATLPVVDGARLNAYPRRPFEIRTGHHDERIAPAQFQHRLLNLPARLAGHLRARRLAASERHGLYAWIADHALHLRGADQQPLKHVRRKPRAADDVLDFERAPRHVGRMFQQPHVARHQRRSREPEHLPEWEVPGHDGQHRPDWFIPDEAAPGPGLHRLVRQQPFAVLHVVAAGPRALGRLGPCRADELPHLERHDAAQPVLLGFQNLSRRVQPARALGERSAAIRLIRRCRAPQLVFDLAFGERLECAPCGAGSRINGCDHQLLF